MRTSEMPSNMAMKGPYAGIVSDETQDSILIAGNYDLNANCQRFHMRVSGAQFHTVSRRGGFEARIGRSAYVAEVRAPLPRATIKKGFPCRWYGWSMAASKLLIFGRHVSAMSAQATAWTHDDIHSSIGREYVICDDRGVQRPTILDSEE